MDKEILIVLIIVLAAFPGYFFLFLRNMKIQDKNPMKMLHPLALFELRFIDFAFIVLYLFGVLGIAALVFSYFIN